MEYREGQRGSIDRWNTEKRQRGSIDRWNTEKVREEV